MVHLTHVVYISCSFLLEIDHSLANEVPIWSDEFNYEGVPDPDVWSYDTGRGNGGWGNAELQMYTTNEQNVKVSNGSLRITGQKNHLGHSFTSARLKTLNKVTVKYGRIEGSIKVPDLSDGLWPAFWLLGNNFPSVGWPSCGEIDICELGNRDAIVTGSVNRRVGSTAHWERSGSHASFGHYKETAETLNNAFHNYTLSWTPWLITTYVDGNLIWQMDISPESCTDCTEFHKPHFIILNLAIGGRYTGIADIHEITAPFPAEYAVDYVRIYENEWTEVGGTYFPSAMRVVDCGCDDCSSSELDQIVTDESGSFSCRHRINELLMNDVSGVDEREACTTIASRFSQTCGLACDPRTCKPPQPLIVTDCGCGAKCASSTLDEIATDTAGSYSCRSRINWVMKTLEKSETDACGQVSKEFPDVCGVGCNPYGGCSAIATAPLTDCGCEGTCSDTVLDQLVVDNTGSHSCRDRINLVMKETRIEQEKACSLVANEFPHMCGNGCDPSTCVSTSQTDDSTQGDTADAVSGIDSFVYHPMTFVTVSVTMAWLLSNYFR